MANTKSKEITLQFNLEEVNVILESLGHLPFMKVYRIIEKIHVQASAADNNPLQQAAAPRKSKPKRVKK